MERFTTRSEQRCALRVAHLGGRHGVVVVQAEATG
jgi:hypothetical protein